MGQKLVCFGPLWHARSRQDESRELHEVGSKRPSSGCNGVHVLSLYPLIWRLLSRGVQPGGIYVCVGAVRADSRRSGVGPAPRPQALPMPAAALILC
jgi:hypothetical protein